LFALGYFTAIPLCRGYFFGCDDGHVRNCKIPSL
jgi:hypothetical protein